MDEDKLLDRLCELIGLMAFDYDRMSQAGQETFDEMCTIVNKLQGG